MSELGLLAESVWQRIAEYGFYGNAFLGGLAVSLTCSVLSAFVVLRRMAFIGQGVSHAAFGGVGAAMLAGVALASVRPTMARDVIVAAFCIATAVIIGYLSRKGKLSEDVAIGIALAAAMAIGVLLLDIRAGWLEELARTGRLDRTELGYTPSFHDILFGNIYLITGTEVALAWILAAVVIGAMALTFKELVFAAFDEETATVFGVRTGLMYYGLLVALGLAIVAAMRTVGVVMVSALLVLPGASARYWSGRIGWVTIISAALGAVGLTGGLLLTVWLRHNLSPGAVIVLTMTAIFLVSYFVSAIRRRLKR